DHLAALRQQPLASRFWVPRTLFLPRK
ncbi:leucyl/phenylalanyl-tRNA--protein transferase, partial [Salmonella enterica subsp. enterica serovar Typhimurium]|nr:leucyl/phenylalanyl-tRNA--protein transferase [Salmonella enterica subsp. enterica serovar Typhimurium]